MRYLLDVNALIAYGFRRHDFHDRVGAWIRSRKGDHFLTCSITELGFVRVLGNVRDLWHERDPGEIAVDGTEGLEGVSARISADGNDISALPAWVNLQRKPRTAICCNSQEPMERFWPRWMREFPGLSDSVKECAGIQSLKSEASAPGSHRPSDVRLRQPARLPSACLTP